MHVRVCLPRQFKFIFSYKILRHKIEFWFFLLKKIILVFPIFSHATALIAEYRPMLVKPAAPPPMPVFCKHCCNADSSYIPLKSLKIVFRTKIILNPFFLKKMLLNCLSIAKHACQCMFRRFKTCPRPFKFIFSYKKIEHKFEFTCV